MAAARQHGRARGACNVAVLKREDFVCGTLHPGFAGRHGGQRAPGRGCSGRRLSENVTVVRIWSSLSDLPSSFVPHARLFSLHPSLVSENLCRANGVGVMNFCGFMQGAVMYDNSFGMHVNSCGAMVTHGEKTGPEDFPGGGNRSGVCCLGGLS